MWGLGFEVRVSGLGPELVSGLWLQARGFAHRSIVVRNHLQLYFRRIELNRTLGSCTPGTGFDLTTTWTPTVGKIIAQILEKTAQRDIILHTFNWG